MKLLIDYDNIPERIRRKGLVYSLDKVANSIDQEFQGRIFNAKLYGGWYECTRFTSLAQKIVQQISEKFPRHSTVMDGKTVTIVPELARRLEARPRQDIYYTFRRRQFSNNILTIPKDQLHCRADSDCPARSMIDFLKNKRCPKSNCEITQSVVLKKHEQKLVDTMMVADIVYLAKMEKTLCVVSSDDDILPGIITAISFDCVVIHVKKRPSYPDKFDFLGSEKNYHAAFLD